MSIKIVTDSTAYLPKSLIEAYDIAVVSLNVVLDDKITRELDTSNAVFYQEMSKAKNFPTSSQPSPEEMLSTFENILANGDSIVGIFMASELSGTYQSTHLYKNLLLEKYPDATIELIDCHTCCMQMGYTVVEAAKAAKAGKTLEEILDITNWVISHSRFLFTPATLDYLQKGGRIGGAAALLGNLLQLKPILTVVDGKVAVLTKIRTKKKAVSTLVDIFLKDLESEYPLGGVTVHHINCEEEGLILKRALEEKLDVPVYIESIGPIVGLHVGPGAIGLAYFLARSS